MALGLAPAASALPKNASSAASPSSASPAPAAPTATGQGSDSADPEAGEDPDWNSAEAEAFWTSDRMEAAVPETPATSPAPTAPTDAATTPSPTATPAKATAQPLVGSTAAGPARQATAVPAATHFAGVPSVGTLYYLGKDQTAHDCTASVVKSPGKNLILTAGHCNPGSGAGARAAFVPQYNKGKQPGYTLPGHSTSGTGSNLDFAFATVADRDGRKLEDVTGGNTLTRTPSYTNTAVTVIGYPGKGKDSHDQAISCKIPTVRLPGAGLTQMKMACDGYWDGVSGGPWMTNFNGTTGDIIGNVGGLNGGGLLNPNEKYYDRFSYSPMYGDQIFSLYQQATTGAVPPPAAYSMGDRAMWRNARHVVAGNFTAKARAEDMITVWVDGEVTLYHGDGNTHFTGETQLVPPKSIWKDAVSITAGTFTPESNQSGLVVRWIDGELDLYPNVSAAGIGNEVRLENSNSTWTKATAVAGQFGGNGKVPTALVVAWSDGHVSEFPNITSHSMAGEVQMIAANKTWTWMRGITAGDLAGNNGSDLVVRWLDGTLTLYPDVDNSGTHQEITLLPPNTAWTNVTDMTVGNFSANGWPDDLVALFPDGQLTMYPDSGSKGLGAAVSLVA
jgi:V8-like Glu-specific endopeptidase